MSQDVPVFGDVAFKDATEGREVGGGFRMGGTQAYLWWIHDDVWQKTITIL